MAFLFGHTKQLIQGRTDADLARFMIYPGVSALRFIIQEIHAAELIEGGVGLAFLMANVGGGGSTLLHTLASKNQLHVIRGGVTARQLSQGPHDSVGRSALWIAAYLGGLGPIRGVTAKILAADFDRDGTSALAAAVFNGHIHQVLGWVPKTVDHDVDFDLALALRLKHRDIQSIEPLLSHGADSNVLQQHLDELDVQIASWESYHRNTTGVADHIKQLLNVTKPMGINLRVPAYLYTQTFL
jgi:hypothetical protein